MIFFDLTQLVLRVALPTPSGIGRVELAYAQHLLARYPDKIRFIFALTRLVQIIPTNIAARYIKEIELVWKNEDSTSDALGREIESFLDLECYSLAALNGRAKPDHSRRNRRIFMIADLLLRLALRLIQPKNLAKYSGSREKNAYISVSNSIMGSNWLNRWLERSPSVAAIFLLHDVIPITNPEFTYPTTTVRHRRYVTRMTKSANTIIANSKFTYECLKEYAFAEDLRLPEVEVAPLGVDDCFVTGGALQASKTPYFVFIATIEPRKNHIMLLQVWQRLVAKLGPACPKLLLIGRRGWENENAVDLLERSVMLREYVLECGNVPDQLLVKILAGARAALFPSHVEGYGLPLSEALSVGVPVICSDLPPFREIADGIPEYADPLAGRGWLKLIMEYSAVDNPKRAAQIDRIKQYKPHRWSDHLAVLDEVLANVGAADGPGAPPITAAIGNDDLEPPPGPPKLTFVADKRG